VRGNDVFIAPLSDLLIIMLAMALLEAAKSSRPSVVDEPSLEEWNDNNIGTTFSKPNLIQTRDCTRLNCRLFIYERSPLAETKTPVVVKRYLYMANEEEEDYDTVDCGWEGCVFLYKLKNSGKAILSKLPQEEIYQMMLLIASGIALMPRRNAGYPQIKNVLNCGLGTGMLPKGYLLLHKDVKVTSLEIEPTMVEVAQAMFGLPKANRLKIIVEDAKKFIRRQTVAMECGKEGPETQFDIIFMDVTNSGTEEHPRWCETKKILDTIQWMLTKNGVFVSNVMMMEGQVERVERKFVKHFTKVWKLVERDETNSLFFCVHNPPPFDIETVSNWLPENYPNWLIEKLAKWGPRIEVLK